MKTQRDKLQQYQKKIRVITDRETQIARTCLSLGQKDKALLALRKKKYQESLLAQTDAQLEQLEKLTGSVEFALVQKDVVFGLKRGTEVLREINREMGGVEGVERLVGENESARREAEELGRVLAGQLSNSEEDEVEDELEELEREVVAERDGIAALPDVPRTELERVQKQKERAKERRKVAMEAV